jgi:hypothetical protein
MGAAGISTVCGPDGPDTGVGTQFAVRSVGVSLASVEPEDPHADVVRATPRRMPTRAFTERSSLPPSRLSAEDPSFFTHGQRDPRVRSVRRPRHAFVVLAAFCIFAVG